MFTVRLWCHIHANNAVLLGGHDIPCSVESTMPGVETSVEPRPTLNAIRLTNAVLCVECDVLSDSPHDCCLVCGSRSLFNIGRLLGGMPKERAKVVEEQQAPAINMQRLLTFPVSERPPLRRHRRVSR